jgi:hypothetical protein
VQKEPEQAGAGRVQGSSSSSGGAPIDPSHGHEMNCGVGGHRDACPVPFRPSSSSVLVPRMVRAGQAGKGGGRAVT